MSKLSVEAMKGVIRIEKVYGEILKRRRRERGMSMTELAERTGVGREAIEDAEQRFLSLSTVQKQKIRKFLRRQRII